MTFYPSMCGRRLPLIIYMMFCSADDLRDPDLCAARELSARGESRADRADVQRELEAYVAMFFLTYLEG
jgi:hypothetical protein